MKSTNKTLPSSLVAFSPAYDLSFTRGRRDRLENHPPLLLDTEALPETLIGAARARVERLHRLTMMMSTMAGGETMFTVTDLAELLEPQLAEVVALLEAVTIPGDRAAAA